MWQNETYSFYMATRRTLLLYPNRDNMNTALNCFDQQR